MKEEDGKEAEERGLASEWKKLKLKCLYRRQWREVELPAGVEKALSSDTLGLLKGRDRAHKQC